MCKCYMRQLGLVGPVYVEQPLSRMAFSWMYFCAPPLYWCLLPRNRRSLFSNRFMYGASVAAVAAYLSAAALADPPTEGPRFSVNSNVLPNCHHLSSSLERQ